MFFRSLIPPLHKSASLIFNTRGFLSSPLLANEAPATILLKLKADMKQAMREKQRSKLNVIKTIISDIGYAEKSTQPFSVIKEDDQVAPIIYRAIKKRSESIEQYRQGGRDDLVASEKEEVEILQSYLPTPYTEEELLIEIDAAIKATSSTTVKDLGNVLKSLTLEPSRAPKSLVAQLVKGRLSAKK